MGAILIATEIGGQNPFDIRLCPIWAIPQLASFKRLCKSFGVDIEFFEFKHGGGIGLVTVGVAGLGIFSYTITKWDMNEPWVPELYPEGPAPRPMRVGDKVRSKNYAIEGVIQDIGPCSHPKYGRGCGEIELTLDAPGNGVQFYYHASSFEIISE